ncbi:MAG: GGDEF domain-containing protein [Bacilli bacterium]|nr:GGDEF domain-containing protein [Bacilli bacterium]
MSNAGKYHRKGVSLKFLSWIISVFVILISSALVVSLVLISHQNDIVNETEANYIALKESSNDVQSASDYLTAQVRLFVQNADKKYMDNYFVEANVTKRREKALERIHAIAETTSRHDEIHENINAAVEESMDLMELEFEAMKLTCEDQNISYAEYPEVANANIESVDPSNRRNVAFEKVLGDAYVYRKEEITHHIDLALEIIDSLMSSNSNEATKNLQYLIVFQSFVIALNIGFAAASIVTLFIYIIKPINSTLEAIEKNEKVYVSGSREFNYLVDAYNEAYSQNEKVKEKLKYEAEHDKLTNLYNRTGYASLYRTMRLGKTLYALLDIDGFKQINDEFGHDIGDRVLVRLAEALDAHFNEDNASIFRIGGDEFAILIENADESVEKTIVERFERINQLLGEPKGKIPSFTLSVGIAHGNEDDTTDTLFKKADEALYKAKQSGKSGVVYDK